MDQEINPIESPIIIVKSGRGKELTGDYQITYGSGRSKKYSAGVKSFVFKHTSEGHNDFTIVIGFNDMAYADKPEFNEGRHLIIEFGYIKFARMLKNIVIMDKKLSLSSQGYDLTLTLVDAAFYIDSRSENTGDTITDQLEMLLRKGSTASITWGGTRVLGANILAYDTKSHEFNLTTPWKNNDVEKYTRKKPTSNKPNLPWDENKTQDIDPGLNPYNKSAYVRKTTVWAIDGGDNGTLGVSGLDPNNSWTNLDLDNGINMINENGYPITVATTDEAFFQAAKNSRADLSRMFRGKASVKVRKPEIKSESYKHVKAALDRGDFIIDPKKGIYMSKVLNLSVDLKKHYELRTRKLGFDDIDIVSTTTDKKGNKLYLYKYFFSQNIGSHRITGTRTSQGSESDLFRDFSDESASRLTNKVINYWINELGKGTSGSLIDPSTGKPYMGNRALAKVDQLANLLMLLNGKKDIVNDVNSTVSQSLNDHVDNDPNGTKVSLDGNTVVLHNNEPVKGKIHRVYTLDPIHLNKNNNEYVSDMNSRIISVEASTNNMVAKMKKFNIAHVDDQTKHIKDLESRVDSIQQNDDNLDVVNTGFDEQALEHNVKVMVKKSNDILKAKANKWVADLIEGVKEAETKGIGFQVNPGENFKLELTNAEVEGLSDKYPDLKKAMVFEREGNKDNTYSLEIDTEFMISWLLSSGMYDDQVKRQSALVEKLRNKLTIVVLGDPNVGPGQTILVKNISKKYSKKWLIQTATHNISPETGFKTTIECTLPYANSLYNKYVKHGSANRNGESTEFDPLTISQHMLTDYLNTDPVTVDNQVISESISNVIDLERDGDVGTGSVYNYNLKGGREGIYTSSLDNGDNIYTIKITGKPNETSTKLTDKDLKDWSDSRYPNE